MTHEDKGHFEVEDRGAVLIVRVDGGPHGVFGLEIANQLEKLVDRVDRDPNVHAVVLTGAHPERFVSHADVRWLQEEGAAVPPLGRRGASVVARVARSAGTKKPWIDRWSETASTDSGIVRAWWQQWPNANIGILTGEDSALVVLDIDPDKGGDDSLYKLIEHHGALPETVEALTGDGAHVRRERRLRRAGRRRRRSCRKGGRADHRRGRHRDQHCLRRRR
jgi:hypothetical protein